mmetsp:Transcript_24758/g.56211  ORF Transcript_24758/g.56211 Transcript_24758/m.56211 type:complete len:410 (+) Transcript_24758:402-1631(+)
MPPDDDLVPVLQKLPGLRPHLDILGPRPVQLQQAPETVLGGARNGTRPQEIPGLHRAPPAGVVGQLLREGPIHVLHVTSGDHVLPLLFRCLQGHRQLNVNIGLIGSLVLEVGERRRVLLLRGGHSVRGQGVQGNHPGCNCGAKILPQERAQGLVLPLLDPSRGPIVHERHSEDVVLRLRQRDGIALLITRPHKDGHLQLNIQQFLGTPHRIGCVFGESLAVRPSQRSAGHDDGRSTTMVSHGNVQPVGHQGVVLSTEHNSHIRGMLPRGVEIGVVPNVSGQKHVDRILSHHCLPEQGVIPLDGVRMVIRKQLLQLGSDLAPSAPAGAHECIEGGMVKDLRWQQIVLAQHPQIDDLVSQRHPDRRRPPVAGLEYAVWQVLKRKISRALLGKQELRQSPRHATAVGYPHGS